MRRKPLLAAATGFCLGGLLIGYSIYSTKQQAFATASRLFAAFDTKTDISEQESRAIGELKESSRGVRSAFLGLAIADDDAVAKLRPQGHSIAIALSQVDFREAGALLDQRLLPCLERSTVPAVLQECSALLHRWSLAETLQVRASAVETHLTDLLLAEQQTSKARVLADVVGSFAPLLNEKDADAIAAGVSGKIRDSFSRERLTPLFTALGGLVPRISVQAKVQVANLLVERIISEQNAQPWEAALEPLKNTIPEADADRLAAMLTSHVALERDHEKFASVLSALTVLASRVSARQAGEIAQVLLAQMQSGDVTTLSMCGEALGSLAGKLPAEVPQQARELFINALREQEDTKSIALLGYTLAQLSGGVSRGGFDEAVRIVVKRLAQQSGASEIALLDSSLEGLVKPGISPETAASSARLLVDRIRGEHEIPDEIRVMVGLDLITKQVPAESAPSIVSTLLDRMQATESSAILRAAAFNIGAFGDRAGTVQIVNAAGILKRNIEATDDAGALRGLAAGLMQLGKRAPDDVREELEHKARRLMETAGEKAKMDLEAILQAVQDDSEDDKEAAAKLASMPTLDAAIAQQLFDPLCDPLTWSMLAKTATQAPGASDNDDDEMADFHQLLVEDDDGYKPNAHETPLDFHRLSDVLDKYRPQTTQESGMSFGVSAGAGLMAASLLFASVVILRRR